MAHVIRPLGLIRNKVIRHFLESSISGLLGTGLEIKEELNDGKKKASSVNHSPEITTGTEHFIVKALRSPCSKVINIWV